jgi:ribose transport system substrate-binding protein
LGDLGKEERNEEMRVKLFVLLAALLGAMVLLTACGGGGSSSSSGSTEAETTETSEGSETSEGTGGEEEEGGEETASSGGLEPFEATVDTALEEITEWPEDAPTEPVKIESGKSLVFIPCGLASPGCRVIGESAEEAAKKLGWSFKVIDGELSPTKTRSAFEQAIALNPDAILTTGIDPTQYADLIKKAHSDGIKYVAGFSDNEPGELNEAEVDTKAALSGKIIASKAIVDNNGEGQYALFNFPVFKVLRDRMTAVKETIEECEKCEIVAEEEINPAEAGQTLPSATSAVVQKNPDLSAIITGIDGFAAEQLPTLNGLGYEGGLYSVNGEEQAIKAIEKGEENATVANPLVWGGWAEVDDAARLFAGMEPSGGGIPLRLLDKENLPPNLGPQGFETEFEFKPEFEKLWGLK